MVDTPSFWRRLPLALLILVTGVLVWSGIRPNRTGAWIMETVWVVAGLVAIVALRRRFPLTPLLLCVLAAWAVVLCYGGHYTYALTPLGDWARETFGLARNPYDRLGHLMQGFAPAIAFREVLWRTSPLRGSRWLAPLTVACCLSLSALWELLEWAGAYLTAAGSPDFLGGQGDPWDTQWDILCALLGALLALTVLSHPHSRQLQARSQPHRS
ncbi:DUF2238 domain-containing protein [Catellatospora tritici]|uniref:DUF2238 domain-containing protein n=1 Tax=Catellatospora tritici TaxID=2851566 RepID=UPI0027E12503|nr:DUF2238 domain-containing protein [Catellatospora tritici]